MMRPSLATATCVALASLGGTIYFPGAVQWDRAARTWIVFDQECDRWDYPAGHKPMNYRITDNASGLRIDEPSGAAISSKK